MDRAGWPTAITKVESNKIVVRGYLLEELMGRASSTQAAFLLLTGKLPTASQVRLLDAVLVSSVDHGVTSPSCQAVRTAALTGAPLNAALAAGILCINKHHGGAIEDCMRLLAGAVAKTEDGTRGIDDQAQLTVAEFVRARRRLPGFGHRLHTNDPRATRLFGLARELGLGGKHLQMAEAIREALKNHLGRDLPINVDGAIAAVLADLEVPAELGNAFFILARLPGMVAHYLEEKHRMRPMRHLEIKEHYYDGPEERSLPAEL